MYTGNPYYTLNTIECTSGIVEGIVVKTLDEIGYEDYVGFYIPKILGLMDISEGPACTNESINMGIFANTQETKVDVASSVPICNYIKVPYNVRSNWTQPCIALGETADIFFINGDYKKARYTDNNNRNKKRKTDTIKLYVYGKDNVDTDGNDSWHLYISSKDKKITLHSANENGESYTYDIGIDANGNTAYLQDNEGNKVYIASDNKEVGLVNTSGSSVTITDKDISATCEGAFSVDCDMFTVAAKTAATIDAKTKCEITSPKISAKGSATVEIAAPLLKAAIDAMFECSSPMSVFSGVIGAASLAVCTSPGGSPSLQQLNASGAVMSQAPTDVMANGNKTMAAILAMIPFLEKSGIAAGVVTPLATMIPNPLIKG